MYDFTKTILKKHPILPPHDDNPVAFNNEEVDLHPMVN
jgi:hypothetical protein